MSTSARYEILVTIKIVDHDDKLEHVERIRLGSTNSKKACEQALDTLKSVIETLGGSTGNTDTGQT